MMEVMDCKTYQVGSTVKMALPAHVFGYSVRCWHRGRNCAVSPYGNEFVTLTSGGVKAEGEPMPETFPTAKAAMSAFMSNLLAMIGEKKNVVFRRDPEMREQDGKFCVVSRLDVG